MFLLIYFNLTVSLKPFVILVPFSLLLLMECHRQNWSAFIVTEKLHRLILQNKKMAEEMKSNELRYLVGNVAHELKTVSSFRLY